LNKSKPGVKVERRDNGQPEKHKCLRQVIKKQAVATRTERFTYKPQKDGNVFDWILLNAEVLRQLRRMERDDLKEAAAKSEGLDATKVEN
jgi:hypothetical protein